MTLAQFFAQLLPATTRSAGRSTPTTRENRQLALELQKTRRKALRSLVEFDADVVIVTSRYANKELASSNLTPVGITAFPPRWPLGFKVVCNLRDLAPTPSMLSRIKSQKLTPEGFQSEYLARLEELGAQEVLHMIHGVRQDGTKGVALLCFEDVRAGLRCHRRYLADWLFSKEGVTIPEL